jgi:hypothetical protein
MKTGMTTSKKFSRYMKILKECQDHDGMYEACLDDAIDVLKQVASNVSLTKAQRNKVVREFSLIPIHIYMRRAFQK